MQTPILRFDYPKCTEWRKDGELHNEGDEPAQIHSNGAKYWYKRGKIHRDGDKPAVVHSCIKQYYKHDKLHRIGGPAIDTTYNKNKFYINNTELESEPKTPEEWTMAILKYS